MVKDRIRWALPAAFVLIAAAAILILLMRPRERPLLPHATRIARISDAYPFYWWVSDNEILYFRDPSRSDWTLLRRDVNTQIEQPLKGLTRLFAKSGGKPDSIQVAPDGKWVLWTGAQGGTVVATVDGTRHFAYPSDELSEKRWMMESGRWVELICDGSQFNFARFRNMNRPQESQVRPVLPAILCQPDAVDLEDMAPTSDDHMLVTIWNGQPGQITPTRVVALYFTANLAMVGKYFLHPPHEADRGALVFAPLYGRLAWVLEYKPPLLALGDGGERIGFWVSNMRGWQAHEIGSLETTRGGKSGLRPLTVRWSPDGGRLSFVYRDALWTVPAD